LVVAGKYRISTRKAGSQANMLKIADALVEKERAINTQAVKAAKVSMDASDTQVAALN